MPETTRYRLGLNQPAGSPTARRAAEMAEAINQEAAGKFRLDVFPESRLGPDPQMFADLRAGSLEFFMAGAALGIDPERPRGVGCRPAVPRLGGARLLDRGHPRLRTVRAVTPRIPRRR